MMIEFMTNGADVDNFQKISIDAYIAAMTSMPTHNYCTYTTSQGLIIYTHAFWSGLYSMDSGHHIVSISISNPVKFYYIYYDQSAYKKIAPSVETCIRELHILDNPAVPITELDEDIVLLNKDNNTVFARRFKSVKRLVFGHMPRCKIIYSAFGMSWSSLEYIDLRGLYALNTITDDVFMECTALKSVNLDNLSQLLSIGENFAGMTLTYSDYRYNRGFI